MKNSNRLIKFLYTLQLAVLYSIFFLVQFFFNFNASAEGQFSTNAATYYNAPFSHTIHHGKIHSGNSRKISFRLNKRFQLSFIPSCGALCIEAPVVEFAEGVFDSYNASFYSSAIPAATPLRGPPMRA